MKTKFLVFDGVDNTGKSTVIRDLNSRLPDQLVELKFPKILPSGELLRINDEKSFELLFTMFEHLDRSKTYVLDRFITSNLVYDKVLRNEDISKSVYYWAEFQQRFDVKLFLFTRPHIEHDFEDDKIRMPLSAFNGCIDEYKKYGPNVDFIVRENGIAVGVDNTTRNKVIDEAVAFILKQ